VAAGTPQTDDRGAWTEKVLPTDLTAVRDTEREILGRLRDLGYDDDQVFAVRLALEEAIVNAMKHGNGFDPNLSVHVGYRVTPERVEIRVADEGGGFDPGDVPDPTKDEYLERPCGRGIMLMRCYMDEVSFSPRGNEVVMVKHR